MKSRRHRKHRKIEVVENGKVVIEFAYEKRIPLFLNVSLLIDYQGSTAGQ